MSELSLTPIGYMKTSKVVKFQTPHQPKDACDEENIVELIDTPRMIHTIRDLQSFDRVWLIWWFHKNSTWRPLVLPPRGSARRRGVFATRSPHRPNPIGITTVPLIKIDGLKLYVGNCDLLDGTPILDIKPYIHTVDSFPEASLGWIDEVEEELKLPPKFTVNFTELAHIQLDWLNKNWNIDFISRAQEVLSRDPSPHKTRRISRVGKEELRMGCGGWRVFFTTTKDVVLVNRIASGYPKHLLMQEGYEKIPDRDAQLEFMELWS